MITIKNCSDNGLKGVIYHRDEVIGVCNNAETLLSILCQIKKEQSDDYKMEVDVEIDKGVRRTYTYKFTKEGKMIPASYPGVTLWIDNLSKKLLYLYGFKVSYDFKL